MTTINPSMNVAKTQKVDEQPIFVSSRNTTRPPLGKKDSQSSIKPPGASVNLSLTIPEEPTNLTISSKGDKKEDDDIIRPPPRLMGRRLSTEMKTEKNE